MFSLKSRIPGSRWALSCYPRSRTWVPGELAKRTTNSSKSDVAPGGGSLVKTPRKEAFSKREQRKKAGVNPNRNTPGTTTSTSNNINSTGKKSILPCTKRRRRRRRKKEKVEERKRRRRRRRKKDICEWKGMVFKLEKGQVGEISGRKLKGLEVTWETWDLGSVRMRAIPGKSCRSRRGVTVRTEENWRTRVDLRGSLCFGQNAHVA